MTSQYYLNNILKKKALERKRILEWNDSDNWKSFYNNLSKIMPKAKEEQEIIKNKLPF